VHLYLSWRCHAFASLQFSGLHVFIITEPCSFQQQQQPAILSSSCLTLPPMMESEVTGNEGTSANGHAKADDEGQVLKALKEVKNRALPQDTSTINIERFIAEELNQMSSKDRETVHEEIHGVNSILEETEELICTCFEKMEIELNKIQEKPAYEEAKRISSDYVTSRKFRLMFLRAERFDPEKAARRQVKFMEAKQSLFGRETLARPICFSDLDEDDQATLKSGVFQILPSRDQAGRPIMVNFETLIPQRCYKRVENMVCRLLDQAFDNYDIY
jgi:hypothetical protein